MIKDNNKGITTIEIILCFVLVFIMTFSMYGTVSSYNDKRVIEKDKNEILSYKYLLTKTIQDDFVNNELSHVSIENNFDPSGKKTYILHCTLKNGTKKILKVEQTLGYSTYNPTGLKNQSDSFMISYGTEGDLIEYPLPNLGSSTVKADPANGISEHTIQELSIQDVRIEVLEHQVLSIQIVFYHPNFGNEYGISIMAPVNYVPDINLPLTSYTLLYDDNGGSGCSDKSIHKMEDDYWGELCTPTKTKNHFDGWKDGANFVTAETKATKNITVKASWTPIYTLTYDDNGGSGCSSQSISKIKNEKWGTLCTPTRSGYQFTGWKEGETAITSDSTATKDITVKASWRKNVVRIRYNGNGGTWYSSNTSYKVNASKDVLTSSGNIFEQIIKRGEETDLYNYNNHDAIAFSYKGYHGKSGEEWIASNGAKFNQGINYTAETFAMNGAGCDLNQSDCVVNLKTNWTINVITLRFKSNATSGLNTCNTTFPIDSNGYLRNTTNTDYQTMQIEYNHYLGENGVFDYHNKYGACFEIDYYTAEPGEEWVVNGHTIDQSVNYNINTILDYAGCSHYRNCTIDLSVNWRKPKLCTIYSCNGGEVIQGPKNGVSQDIIGHTGDNCDTRCRTYDDAYTIGRLKQYGLADHSPETDYGTGTIVMARAGCTATKYWHLGWGKGPSIDETKTFNSWIEFVEHVDALCSPDKCTRNHAENLKHNDDYVQLYAGWTGTNC